MRTVPTFRFRRTAGLATTLIAAVAIAASSLVACRSPADSAPEASALKPDAVFRPAGSIDDTELATIRDYLSERIAKAIDRNAIPSMAIGLYDDTGMLWADGFGKARDDGMPASYQTVYRVGSVSKLFTDIAVMQLVAKGELDLDAPVTDYLTDFQPENPFDVPITLRQLMCHRAGLVREPPVGHYIDASEPSLRETVESLNATTLVHEPGSTTKYSNAGIAVVGYVLEVVTGKPFDQAVREAVLDPLGMKSSDFVPSDRVSGQLADAEMRTLDRRRFEAPTFQLGMAPAGSLYSTIEDLAAFSRAIMTDGDGLIDQAALEEMLTPQFAEAGATAGFGLGFGIGNLRLSSSAAGNETNSDAEPRSFRRVGHNGAIYGFSTSLVLLPDEDLGVAITSSLDVSNGLIAEVADEALDLLLRAQLDDPELVSVSDQVAANRALDTAPIDSELIERLAGHYEGEGVRFELVARLGRNDEPTLLIDLGSGIAELRQRTSDGNTVLVADDADGRGLELSVDLTNPADPIVSTARRSYSRIEPSVPAAAPSDLLPAIGEYGEDHMPTVLFERGGQLWAQIEWLELTPLHRTDDPNAFDIRSGMYTGEQLTLERSPDGSVSAVTLGAMPFDRRAGTAAGETFRIDPIRPVDDLREEALAASPPQEEPLFGDSFRESDLVELTSLDDSIRLDVRYATTNNFMSTVFYDEPRAFLQRPAAEALVRAHQALEGEGYGLLIHDAYRPWYVTKMFFDATPEDKKIFVADPGNGSRHNRGCAVDLTLYDRSTGAPVQMVGGYDEMTDRSFPDYPGGTERQRYFRELLRKAMEAEGFEVYEFEWWHFDYEDWRHYGLQNITFDQIGAN